MLGEHDHDRIDAREMLGAADRAFAAPAGAKDRALIAADAAEEMAVVPFVDAPRRAPDRRVALAHHREQAEHAPRAPAERIGADERREQRHARVEAQEEQILPGRFERIPGEAPLLVEHRIQLGEAQQPRLLMGDELGEPAGIEPEMIGAVQPGPGEPGDGHRP